MTKVNELIKKIAKADAYEVMEGEVVDVDEINSLITVKLLEGVEIANIKLRAVTGNDGVIFIPKKNSEVVFAKIRGQENYVIINASEIDKVIIDINDEMHVDASKVVFNGGNQHGVPLAQKVVDRLNTIENDLNTLKTVFSGWVTAPQDGGSALKSAASTWYGQQLTNSAIADIENDKITQ